MGTGGETPDLTRIDQSTMIAARTGQLYRDGGTAAMNKRRLRRVGVLLTILVVAAAITAAAAFARNHRTERVQLWRVTQFSFRYVEETQNPQACVGGSVSGSDVARESATLELGGLRSPRPVEYQYTPGGTPGGPDSRGHSVLALGHTVERQVTKDVVDCDTNEHLTVACKDPIRRAYTVYDTGAYSLWPVRKRSVESVTVLVMGDELLDLLSCSDDPGVVLAPAFLEAATHDTYVIRTTVPLRSFTRPMTTITISRTLPAPPGAGSGDIPLGSVKVDARLVLRKSVRNHVWCPAKDRLFVCDKR
jgi:hypothetical protein